MEQKKTMEAGAYQSVCRQECSPVEQHQRVMPALPKFSRGAKPEPTDASDGQVLEEGSNEWLCLQYTPGVNELDFQF